MKKEFLMALICLASSCSTISYAGKSEEVQYKINPQGYCTKSEPAYPLCDKLTANTNIEQLQLGSDSAEGITFDEIYSAQNKQPITNTPNRWCFKKTPRAGQMRSVIKLSTMKENSQSILHPEKHLFKGVKQTQVYGHQGGTAGNGWTVVDEETKYLVSYKPFIDGRKNSLKRELKGEDYCHYLETKLNKLGENQRKWNKETGLKVRKGVVVEWTGNNYAVAEAEVYQKLQETKSYYWEKGSNKRISLSPQEADILPQYQSYTKNEIEEIRSNKTLELRRLLWKVDQQSSSERLRLEGELKAALQRGRDSESKFQALSQHGIEGEFYRQAGIKRYGDWRGLYPQFKVNNSLPDLGLGAYIERMKQVPYEIKGKAYCRMVKEIFEIRGEKIKYDKDHLLYDVMHCNTDFMPWLPILYTYHPARTSNNPRDRQTWNVIKEEVKKYIVKDGAFENEAKYVDIFLDDLQGDSRRLTENFNYDYNFKRRD